MKSAGTMMSKLSVRTMKGVLDYATSKVKVRIQSWESSPHSLKLKNSSARGTRYEDGLDNAGGSFRVGRVAKIEPPPALYPQEGVREQAEKTPTRRREQSTAVTTLGDVEASDEVDQMESRERSDEEGGKGKGKDPVLGVVAEDTYIEVGAGRYEWVPATAILDGLPPSVDEEDAMKPTRNQTASPSLDEDRDLQMALNRARNPSQNPASVFRQAMPRPSIAAHWARRDEEASRHPHFGGLDGADDRPAHSTKRSGDEEDQPPRKRRKVSEAIKEAPAAAQGGQGTKRKVEAESEEQARKRRAGERNEPETMEDDLEWAERMDRELAASVARRRRDEAGAMGLDGAMSSSLRRRRDDDGEEDGGRRPSCIHRDRRARWEADQADLKAARVEQERLRREDQRLNSEAFEAWMAEKHGEDVAPGQTPTFMPTLANQRRNAEAVERMKVMIERHEAEEKEEAQARAEELRRRGETEAALEHSRELTAEEAFDEEGRRTEFDESGVEK